MVARNDITGDLIQSKASTKAFDENMDRIFNSEEKQKQREAKKKADAEYWAKVNAETAARLAQANKELSDIPVLEGEEMWAQEAIDEEQRRQEMKKDGLEE